MRERLQATIEQAWDERDTITAEGVESEHIRSALKEFGCTEAQGWLFGRAVSADTVRTFLEMKQLPDPGQAPDGNPARPSDDGADSDDGTRFTPRVRKSW